MQTLLEAPAAVDPTGPTLADDRWWSLESARLDDRRELEAHYAEASTRDFDSEADDAQARDRYQCGILPF